MGQGAVVASKIHTRGHHHSRVAAGRTGLYKCRMPFLAFKDPPLVHPRLDL